MSAAEFEGLVFLPLGGAGEIGMNLNLYGLDGRWIMLDCGVTFADEHVPGVDLILPDPGFIAERRDSLEAIVLTHGHEDHLGAVAHLWPRLGCPIYATPFTAALMRRKLAEAGLAEKAPLREIPLGARFERGPFDVEFVTVTHSILEPNSVVLRTRLGAVVHSGDFKIDPEPLIGDATHSETLEALGREGVAALVCDSTNATRKGTSGSEGALRRSLDELVGEKTGRVAVATFASNAARIETLVKVAARHGRHAALVGRSLWRIVGAAREAGYLADLPPLLSAEEAGWLPPGKVLAIATGCQGEPRAAMYRIAAGDHPHVSLEPGDTAIFASKIIPGNERAIARLHNRLISAGIELITEKDRFVHVSGHPMQDELTQFHRWLRPEVLVPVHGEPRHLAAHAALGRANGIGQVPVVTNGDVLRLAPGPAEVVKRVETGRLALDGRAMLPFESGVLRARRRLGREGAVFLAVVVDSRGALLAEPRLRAEGVSLDGAFAEADPGAAIADALAGVPPSRRGDDDALREAARRAAVRLLRRATGKRPAVNVELVRLETR